MSLKIENKRRKALCLVCWATIQKIGTEFSIKFITWRQMISLHLFTMEVTGSVVQEPGHRPWGIQQRQVLPAVPRRMNN